MAVIKKLGDRVEKEHDQFLRDSQRIEDRSGMANGTTGTAPSQGIDFESLVGRSNTLTINGPAVSMDASGDENGWDGDGWGSMLDGQVSTIQVTGYAAS